MIKITVIGGSSVGTPALVLALRNHFAPIGPPDTIGLVLHGRNTEKLAPVAKAAMQLAQGCDWLRVSATTDMAEALDGARFVINQIRVGGLQARAFDETFPITLGLIGEETVGAGGFANAVRTIPPVVKIAQAIEQYAPTALLFSFANPASPVQYALTLMSKLRVIGLCDAAITMTAQAATALDCQPHELHIDYVGMHHFSFIPRLTRAGVDITSKMLDCLERIPHFGMDCEVVRSLGALPTPYLKYFLHQDRILAQQQATPSTRAQQLLGIEADLLRAYESGDANAVGKRSAKWYDAIIAPILVAMICKTPARFALNVINGPTLPWLPADAIIETMCKVNGDDVQAEAADANRELRARIQLNCAYEQLVVEAVLEQDERKALRALTMNPLIGTVDKARAVLKRLWPNATPTQLPNLV